MVIQIAGEHGETITLATISPRRTEATDYWDGNWLLVELHVNVGAFQVQLSGSLRREELADFARQLAQLQEHLRGEAHFQTMEDWLTLDVVGDGRGHFTVRCFVSDYRRHANWLECGFDTDQTFTRSTVAQLAAVVQTYPVVGQP